MSRLILDGILPKASPEYKQSMLDQLVKRLQLVLNVKIETQDDVDETEAINYFLR